MKEKLEKKKNNNFIHHHTSSSSTYCVSNEHTNYPYTPTFTCEYEPRQPFTEHYTHPSKHRLIHPQLTVLFICRTTFIQELIIFLWQFEASATHTHTFYAYRHVGMALPLAHTQCFML